MPKIIFGETGPLINAFYGTMKESAPLAWELNEAFLAMWRPDALINSWVMPDNFHVHVKVMDTTTETVHFANMPVDVHYKVNRPTEEGRSLGANTIHSIDGMIVRELVRRCDYDADRVALLRQQIAEKQHWGTSEATKSDKLVLTLWKHYQRTGYLSARIIDVLNFDNGGHVDMTVISALLDSLPNKPFKVLSIHDCFRCLPSYGNDLRRQYNLQLHLVAKSNLLSDMISQIIHAPVQINKGDPALADDILHSNYSLS